MFVYFIDECNVDAHANISALFLTVCAHGCKINYLFRKWICVVLRSRSLLGGSIGGSCEYTCTVHWTVQSSHEQPGCWPFFVVCTVAQPMSPNFFFEICLETDRLTYLSLDALFPKHKNLEEFCQNPDSATKCSQTTLYKDLQYHTTSLYFQPIRSLCWLVAMVFKPILVFGLIKLNNL